jgi:ribonuclease HII
VSAPIRPTRAGPLGPPPRLVDERKLWGAGHRLVAGIDEVGRGAWAGPLTVGVAVIEGARRIPNGLRDSKMLPEDRREALFERVGAWCTAWAVGHVGPEDCDRLGMTGALRLATRRAFAALPIAARPDAVVLDGNFDYVSPPAAPTLFDDEPPVCVPAVRTVIGADARCASVAAASVLAKVTRDRLMRDLSDSYPPFDFERNKGYPSPTHKRALCGYGMTAIHRRSWVFAEHLPWR